MLASPRGLSQLATSFIAFLRLGIHTRALSSLTIKFTQHTQHATQASHPNHSTLSQRQCFRIFAVRSFSDLSGRLYKFVLYYARQYSIVKDRISSLVQAQKSFPEFCSEPGFCSLLLLLLGGFDMVGLDRLELSTSPLSGVRSSHLSYRPV